MLRFWLVLLCLCSSLACATPQDEDLAYSLGAKLGERLRGEVPDLPLDALLAGLHQAYRGEALRLPPERIEALLAEHEQRSAESRETQARLAEGRFLATEKSRYGVRELAGGVLVRELRAGSGGKPRRR